MHPAFLRRALLSTVAAVAFLSGATVASAQARIVWSYAPSCGPGTACTTARFQITNLSTSTQLFNTLTLTGTSVPYRFAPAAGGTTFYQALDAISPFGGTGTVAPGGAGLFINFLGGNGFAFELTAGSIGYVEAPLTQTPALTDGAFSYTGVLNGGATVAGTIAVIPEPSTAALLGGGLALVGFITRRRRRA